METKKKKDWLNFEGLSAEEKETLLLWAQKVREIQNDKTLTRRQKLKELKKLNNSEAFKSISKFVMISAKKYWENTNWAERGGIIAGSITLGFYGLGGVGLAAGGSAVGLPFVLITTAGGTLIGTIIDRLNKK